MNFVAWIMSFLNEPSTGEGSSQRLMLVVVIMVFLGLIIWLTIKTGAFPQVPQSLFDFAQFIVMTLVAGIGLGKGVNAYKTVKGAADAGTAQ